MSEDYKKIAFEDVKKGHRVHLNFYRDALVFAAYTGTVVDTNTEFRTISLGSDREHFQVFLFPSERTDIFLMEDAPTDTGILRFAGVEHWERHEPRLRDKRLKDLEGDVWAYVDGRWKYWCYNEAGGRYWSSDTTIEDYIEDGFTIVDGLD